MEDLLKQDPDPLLVVQVFSPKHDLSQPVLYVILGVQILMTRLRKHWTRSCHAALVHQGDFLTAGLCRLDGRHTAGQAPTHHEDVVLKTQAS